MNEEYNVDEDLGEELDGGFEFKISPHAPNHEPRMAPEKPEAHINEWCEGCPYPAHGFVCWSHDGDCLRKRVLRINQKKESMKYGAGTVKQ